MRRPTTTKDTPMSKPVIGAQLYSLRNHCKTLEDTVQTLAKVKAIGYTAVQLSGIAPMNDDPDGLAQAIRESGLNACCTHVSFEALLNDTDTMIARHQAWGVKHVATGGCPGTYGVSLAGVQAFAADIATLAQRLAPVGMDFSYHNHHWEFARIEDGRTWLQALYETAPADVLKAELDVHWVTAGGASPATWIRALGPRQPLLHLKDFTVHFPEPENRWKVERRFAPIGSGNLDWPSVLAAAEEVGVEYALVEQDDSYGADPFGEMEKSYNFLARMGYK